MLAVAKRLASALASGSRRRLAAHRDGARAAGLQLFCSRVLFCLQWGGFYERLFPYPQARSFEWSISSATER